MLYETEYIHSFVMSFVQYVLHFVSIVLCVCVEAIDVSGI